MENKMKQILFFGKKLVSEDGQQGEKITYELERRRLKFRSYINELSEEVAEYKSSKTTAISKDRFDINSYVESILNIKDLTEQLEVAKEAYKEFFGEDYTI